jgi:hypothetical protein
MKRTSRRPSQLSGSMRRQLNSYALAASAAGVGPATSSSQLRRLSVDVLVASAAGVSLLTMPPVAEARIVYTPVNVFIENSYRLDLNHDGVSDFYFTPEVYASGSQLSIRPHVGTKNLVWGTDDFAAALKKGAVVGPVRSSRPATVECVSMTPTGDSGSGTTFTIAIWD